MIKHQCGRCGEHFLQSGDLRILNCRLHVLCDACTHFQSGQNCSICNMKNNSETQKVQQQHLFQNSYNTDENHPNADDSTIFYQKNFAPIDNTINYLRPTSSMTGVGPFWPSLANRENSRPQFLANQNDATSAVGQKFFSNNNAPFFSTNDDNIVSLLTNNSSSSTATSFGFLAENKSDPILSKNYLNQHLKQAALYPTNGDRNENLIVKTGVENDLSSNNLPETRFFNNLGSLIGLPHEKIQNCRTALFTSSSSNESTDSAPKFDPFLGSGADFFVSRQDKNQQNFSAGIFLLPQQQSQNSINGINCKNVSSPPGMTGGVFTGLTSLGDISVNTLNTTGIEGASSKFQDSSTLNLASPNSGVRRCSTCGIMLTVQSLNGYHHSSIGNNQSINGVKDLRSTAVFCSNCGKVSPTIATSTYDDKTAPLNDFTANLQVLNHNMANNCTLKNANNQNHQQNFNILNTSPANLSPSCNLATGNSTVSLVDVVTKGEASSFLQSALTSTQNGVCSLHAAASLEIATAFCETCLRFVCGLCNRIPQENNAPRSLSPHSNHKIAYGRSAALSRCRDFLRSPLIAAEFDRFFVRLDDEMRNVEQKSRDVRRDISARVRELITTLQQREQCLLQNEQTIKCEKLRALSEQRETAARLLSELNSATINPELVAAIETSNLSPTGISSPSSEIDVDKWCQIFGQFLRLLKTTLTEPLAEDDRLWFVPGCTAPLHHLNIHHGSANHAGGHQNNQLDSNSLVKLLRSFGCVVTGAFAGQSKLVGEYVRRAVKCKPVVYNVQTRGYFGEACLFGNDKVNIVVRTPQGAFVEGQVIDRKNGTYQCSVTPDVEGNHMVYIYVRNKNICGSPFSLMVRQGRDYSTVGANPLFSFATEGQAEGQLYRPWGIACDKLSRIVVSDRGNNRIQIFDQKGNFLTTFGREGKGDGEFKKPAGLAINNNNEIIVVDKDNHRIQVFTAEGKFIFAFGEEGLLCGQFNYPWDCAVNNAGCIAVSDTRNHRIQLFDSKGSFVRKFPFDFGEPRRNLHSNKGQASTPRGLVFTQDGRLLVTDFNHHRLIVIYPDNSDHARAYGTLGEGNFNFNRPQGIDVDLDGTILLCDGKNNRCQVFTPQLEFLGCFGTENERSVMKTPCDLCVTPEGRVFVVDFDNSMIRVF